MSTPNDPNFPEIPEPSGTDDRAHEHRPGDDWPAAAAPRSGPEFGSAGSVHGRDRRSWAPIATAVSLGAVICLCARALADRLGFGQEFATFAASGLESLPFLPLCVLAYLGERAFSARVLTCGYWIVLIGISVACVWLVTLESAPETLLTMVSHSGSGRLLRALLNPAARLVEVTSFFGCGFAVLVGLVGFLPAVRRTAALLVPIDPNSFVHAVALATVLALTVASLVPLFVLGEPPLLLLANDTTEAANDRGSQLRSTVYGLLWQLPITIIAVGYPIRRNFRQALKRIGLVRPSGWQWILALLLIPILVGINVALDDVIKAIWTYYDWRLTDEQAFEELIKFASNPAGAVVIGVTAGLGEELAVRGVLQPRLGILLSNLFFVSLHALQYNWDGLLSVFVTGLALGVIRKYTNTTTSAIVHGGFDFALMMMSAA